MVLFNYVLMCLIFSTTFLAVKIGVDASAPPFLSGGIRFFVAGLILFMWMLWRKKASLTLLFHKEMLITGFGLTFGTFSALYWGEQYVSSGMAAVLSATGPILVLIIQITIMRHKPSVHSLIGCVIGFIGVIIMMAPSMAVSEHSWMLIGSIVIIAGELFYAGGAIYSKRVAKRFADISPIALNASQMLYGGALLLLLSAFTEQWHFQNMLSTRALGSLLYLIVIGSMIGHSLFYWLIAKTTPIFASTWLYVSPMLALFVGVLFYRESLTWMSAIGAITILIGTAIVNYDSLKQLFEKPLRAKKRLQDVQTR